MSTKTSIKRIAAVAAVALTLGGFSAVSAYATGITATGDVLVTAAQTTNAGSAVAAAETATATSGTNSYVGLSVGATANTPVAIVVTGGTATTGVTTATGTGTGSLVVTGTSGDTIQSFVVNVPTPVAGTIVVKTYAITGGLQGSTAVTTLTITVTAADPGKGVLSVGNTTGFITSVKSEAATPAVVHNVLTYGTVDTSGTVPLAADVSVVAPKGAAGTTALVAGIYGILKDGAVPTANGLVNKKLTATVSGSGLITGNSATDGTLVGISSAARVAVTYTSTTTNLGEYAFNVYSDGSAGVGTVTISYTDPTTNVTTVVATKTVTFYGAEATFTPTVKYAYIPSSGAVYPAAGTRLATTDDAATTYVTPSKYAYDVKISVKDSSGNPVATVIPLVKSADTNIISAGSCTASTSTGSSYCSLTGVSGATGKVTLTFYTGATSSFNLVSTTADITVSSTKADSWVVTADASVNSGQVITYTITAKDKNGLPIPDGTKVSSYFPVSSLDGVTPLYPVAVGGALSDLGAAVNGNPAALFTGVKFLNGVATDTVQAPFGTTSIVATFDNIGGTVATSADAHFTTLALTNQETVLTTAVGGTSDAAAQAAVDAAQEATDAANAAYDAANNAMDSADAATAAAQDASDNASAALAAVTSLSATVAKLVSSVTAIATALAAIKKKLGVK